VAKRKIFYDVDLVIRMCKDGKKLFEISKEVGVDRETLSRFLDKAGVRKKQEKYHFSSIEKEFISTYKSLKSLYKCAKQFGISCDSARKILKKNNILIIRTPYTYDEDFFIKNSREAFYFAGFIAADGCIIEKGKTSKTLQIQIKDKDREVLDRLKKEMRYTGPVRIHKNKACLSIASKKICADLERFGIGPRKSFTYKIPEEIKNSPLIGHFLRGLIDGDGWVLGDGRLQIGLCGSFDCIKDVIDMLDGCVVAKKEPKTMRSIFYIKYFADDAIRISKLIYDDCEDDLCLKRKRMVAENVRSTISNNIPIIAYNGKETVLFDSFRSAEAYGKTRWFICKSINSGNELNGYYWRYATPEDIAKYSTLEKP